MDFDTWMFVVIIIQQDATMYSLFISVHYSTCFGWYVHPSSAAHITVSTVAAMRPLLLPVVNVAGRELQFSSSHILSS